MKRYHFDAGNSNEGPVGFCVAVMANTEEEALEVLRRCLPREVEVRCSGARFQLDAGPAATIEYCTVYLNPDNLTVAHIDEVLDC